MQRTTRLIVSLGFAALAALCGCSRTTPDAATSRPAAPISVKLVAVKRGEATRSVTLPGNVLAYQQAALYAKVAGFVKTVTVDKGDFVKAGAPLADLEVPELIADRVRYQAEADVAALEFKRVSEAQSKSPDLVVPQTVDNAKGKLDVARANLERTDSLLNFAKITAPFAGVITKRMVDPGAFIPSATSGSAAQNAALFTLMDFTKVRVQVAVPESEVPFIKDGLPVRVSVEELQGGAFTGSVTRFAQALDDTTKTMLAEIELPNPSGQLRPGMYASVRVVVESKPDALVVPTDALVVEKTRTSAFRVADGKAKRITVKTGFNESGWAEVVDGLKLDDAVILVGKLVLADGQAVSVMEAR